MRTARERLGRMAGATFAIAAVCTLVTMSSVATAEGATPTKTYDAAVLSQSPIGYWPLREPAKSKGAVDHSTKTPPLGSTGAREGSAIPANVPGPINGTTAYTFGGSACDGVDLDADATNLHPAAGVTVEAWVQTTDPRPLGAIFRARDGGYNLLAGSSGIDFTRYPADKTLHYSTNIADGAWHQLVGAYGTNGYQIFVDGILRASAPNDGSLGYFNNEAAIGRDGHACDGGVPSFKGNIADVAIYGDALAPIFVGQHYQASGRKLSLPSLPVLDSGTFLNFYFNTPPLNVAHGEQCTSGFNVYLSVPNVQAATGAKHCISGKDVNQTTNDFVARRAPLTVTTFGSATSFANALNCTPGSGARCFLPAKVKNTTGDMFAWQPDTATLSSNVATGSGIRPVVDVRTWQSVGGTEICHFGSKTFEQCTQAAFTQTQKDNVCAGDAASLCKAGLIPEPMVSDGGDSGGPVYAYNADRTGVYAIGIDVQAGEGMTFFVPIQDVLARLGGGRVLTTVIAL